MQSRKRFISASFLSLASGRVVELLSARAVLSLCSSKMETALYNACLSPKASCCLMMMTRMTVLRVALSWPSAICEFNKQEELANGGKIALSCFQTICRLCSSLSCGKPNYTKQSERQTNNQIISSNIRNRSGQEDDATGDAEALVVRFRFRFRFSLRLRSTRKSLFLENSLPFHCKTDRCF